MRSGPAQPVSYQAGNSCRRGRRCSLSIVADALILRRRSTLGAPSRPRNLTQNTLQGKKRFRAFALADEMRPGSVHHDLGRARPDVVAGTHSHGVATGRHHCQQVAVAHGELALFVEDNRRLRRPVPPRCKQPSAHRYSSPEQNRARPRRRPGGSGRPWRHRPRRGNRRSTACRTRARWLPG